MFFACALPLLLANAAHALLPSGESHIIGPEYTMDEAWKPCSHCEKGQVFDLFMPIAGSTYDCDPAKYPSLKPECRSNCGQMFGPKGTRNISVYIPAAYKDGDEAAVQIGIEGLDAQNLGVSGNQYDLFDNLMEAKDAARSLPLFVYIALGLAGPGGPAALLGSQCGDDVGTERPIELRTVSDTFAKFLAYEVLPWVANHPQITAKYPNFRFTDDPAGRATQGVSSGGAAAFKNTFLTPDLFGIAISYSGAFVEENPGALNPWNLTMADFWVPSPDGQGLIMAEPLKTGRYSLAVGSHDEGSEKACMGAPGCMLTSEMPKSFNPYDNFVLGNNRTFEALTNKGYQTRFTYALDACHAQFQMVYQDLPNAYIWAWAEWKEKHGTGRKTKQDDDTTASIGHPSGEWPLVMPVCSNGCGALVCTNCGNEADRRRLEDIMV